jgi:GNAT superfamily N-acetyltransferase
VAAFVVLRKDSGMTASAVAVRPAALADADALWPLVRAFATSFSPERGALDGTLPELLAREDTLLLVAEADDRMVGYLLASVHPTLFANAPVAWVEEVMVDERARRGGVGAALMRTAELWAAGAGAAYVSLATRRASDFYRALGYEDSAIFFRKGL